MPPLATTVAVNGTVWIAVPAVGVIDSVGFATVPVYDCEPVEAPSSALMVKL